MFRRLVPLPALLALGVLPAGAVVAGAQTTGGALRTTLSGKNELGGKGEPNGRGTFRATVRNGRLCYTLRYSGVTNPVAAHIHRGTASQDGPIVLDLKPKFRNGRAAACVPANASLLSRIRGNPKGYYTNVHTQKQPAGAIRGQLASR